MEERDAIIKLILEERKRIKEKDPAGMDDYYVGKLVGMEECLSFFGIQKIYIEKEEKRIKEMEGKEAKQAARERERTRRTRDNDMGY
mgnify:CR=1 FL=1